MYALDRKMLLTGLEQARQRCKDDNEMKKAFDKLENKYMNLNNAIGIRKDQISHFILRIGFCKTEDTRRWFLTQECNLLKQRLESLSDEDRAIFMEKNNISYDIISDKQKESMRDKLFGLPGAMKDAEFLKTKYYKIPFEEALQLMAKRQVYLEKGYAYVPLSQLVSTIISRFRRDLSRSLAEASHKFDVVAGDPRISPIIQNLPKQYVGKDYTKAQSIDKLTPQKVDYAADNNMPLCMKHLHNTVKREHKLKHFGRLQYGLFLKGAGLDMDDSIAFFENHFTKIMSHDQFVKGYAYNIRHMHGKEGGRKSYTPYSCMKIIMGPSPEAGAAHGCPYRHMKDSQLASLLSSLSIATNDVNNIVTTAKKSNYQVACQMHFDAVHPGHGKMDLGFADGVYSNHPNQWFEASTKYYKVKTGNINTNTNTDTVNDTNIDGNANDTTMDINDETVVQEEALAM